MSSRALRPLAVAIITLGLGGCGPSDWHAEPISARSTTAFATWRMKAADGLTRDEWRDFDAALQEIRLRVTAEREASGSRAVEEAMCARINGRNFREVLALGSQAKLARLGPIRAELARALADNALLVVAPGDRASAGYLNTLRERQEKHLRDVDAEIEAAQQQLSKLGARSKTDQPADQTSQNFPVAALSREEAMEHTAKLIDEQREAVRFKYGPWPIKFDRDGSQLTGADLTDFRQRRASAAASSRVVIAVRLRNRWWIYDERAESPQFSSAVLKNLTAADRREIDEAWWTLQAEAWARQKAHEEL